MSKILSRATRGRIRKGTTKTVLVLAVSGALYFATTIEPPIVNNNGSNVAYYNESLKKTNDNDDLKNIIIEDSEIVAIVQVCLKSIFI